MKQSLSIQKGRISHSTKKVKRIDGCDMMVRCGTRIGMETCWGKKDRVSFGISRYTQSASVKSQSNALSSTVSWNNKHSLSHSWTCLTPRSGSTVYLTVSYNRYPFLSAYDRELSCLGANWALSLTRFVSLSKGNFYTFSLWSLDAHSQQLSLSWNLSPLSISRFPEIRWKLQRRIG